jgi:hypothetical protein
VFLAAGIAMDPAVRWAAQTRPAAREAEEPALV